LKFAILSSRFEVTNHLPLIFFHLVDLQKNQQPTDQDIDNWLTWKDTYGMFVDDVNLDKYANFVYRYTIPMTRTKVIENVLVDYRQGKLEFIPDILKKITPSDHAFALLSVMNHYKDWESKKDAFVARDTTFMKKVKTKWTQAAARTRINAGWQPAALQAYRKCEFFFKGFMAVDEWTLLKDKVHGIENTIQSDDHARITRRVNKSKSSDKENEEPVAYEFDEGMLEAFECDEDDGEGNSGTGGCQDGNEGSSDEEDEDDEGEEEDEEDSDDDGGDNSTEDDMRVEAV